MEAQVLAILSTSRLPMHARDVRQVLARGGTLIAEHVLVGELRRLMREGHVQFDKGRWRAVGHDRFRNDTHDQIATRPLPRVLQEAIGLGTDRFNSGPSFPLPGAGTTSPETAHAQTGVDDKSALPGGPWGPFRALLDYYRDCIRNEGGSEAMAGLDDLNSKYFFVSRPGTWLPRTGRPWSLSIPLGSHLGNLIPQLASPAKDALLVLGYPLQVIHLQREGEPDSYLLKPVFHIALEYRLQQGALLLHTDDPRVQVNLDWLNHNFRDSDRQRAFLSACGLIGNDSDTVCCYAGPSTEHLTGTLAAFMPRFVHEPLFPNAISDAPLRPPLKTGIYNRAVIMLARRPQYTRSLLRELAHIRKFSDEELDGTALSCLFRIALEGKRLGEDEKHSEAMAADVTPLNPEQHKSVSSLMNAPITVITGPPGTGKSQVVSAALANAHLFGQSVLFSSRNHKAIDAVYERCQDNRGRPLLIRCNSRDDPNLRVNFADGIGMLLAGEADAAAGEEARLMLDNMKLLIEERNEKLLQSDKILDCQERLGLLEEQSTILSIRIPAAIASRLESSPNGFPSKHLRKITLLADSIASLDNGLAARVRGFLSTLGATPAWIALRRGLLSVGALPVPRGRFCTRARLSAFLDHRRVLEDVATFCACRAQVPPLETEIRALPDFGTLASAVADLTARIGALAPSALERIFSARVGLLPGEDRESLANVRSALQYIDSGTAPGALRNSTRTILHTQLSRLLRRLPCWAVTSLSVGSRIPLLPGLFDLAIVDEASQSDIPSAIPLLFRARRAGVVGDPRQLTHITSLSLAKDGMLRRRAGLDRLADQRFSYIATSLYSLFADTNGISPIFLSETYRSVEEIASYSNDLFYGGRLRVATDPSRFPPLPNMHQGIHWTDVEGEVRSGGVSGAHCREEVAVIAHLVREMLIDNKFRGTLGIVTPFREQANRLRDSIFEGDIPWETISGADVAVDTSHGFQGGERDVMLFSLCAGPGMPAGSLHFLRETGNLFNVAASRARAVLHVVGNRNWASKCGIRHVERLAKPLRVAEPESKQGPWAPHDSPWEKYLYEALKAADLTPIPQHPVGYRRLDLALIREAPRALKLDIEVDGAFCHRNPDGTRKLDDIWRDIQLQGMGWRVMRFWVYQLRENMEDCVRRIREVWDSYD